MENPREDQDKRKHEENEDFLTLSLFGRSVRARRSTSSDHEQPIINIPPVSLSPPPPLPLMPAVQMQMQMQMQALYVDFQLPPNHSLFLSSTPAAGAGTSASSGGAAAAVVPPPPAVRSRRNPSQGPREGKSETIPPPFPWATNRRAMIQNLKYLLHNKIFTITGEVQCKRCERKFEMAFDLMEKFAQVWNFIAEHRADMHDRAPDVWMNPTLPTCKHCGQENSVKPVIAEKKKKSINWLFLLLGQMLGCCTLEQLKYFCKHTKNHRTGAKDRVLYLAYLGLCKQLHPDGPFDR